MSNAIIRQQGGRPVVADNVWTIHAGAGAFALGLLVGAAALALGLAGRGRGRTPGRPATPTGWPVAFIHRGGAAIVPEDTIPGFREGLRYGDGVIECDVHTTIDGELVVMHDADVSRTTDGAGPVNRMSHAEVAALDAGYRFSPDGGRTFPWRGKGVRVPRLAEIYAAFPDQPVNVEIKLGGRPDIEQRVADVVAAAGAQSRTLVVSQSWATMRRFRAAAAGAVATASSREELLAWWLLGLVRLTRLVHPGFQALQPPEKFRGLRIVSRAFVRTAHQRGLRVDVWTIDEEADMRRLLAWGVDGIMTDRPDVLARVLAPAPR